MWTTIYVASGYNLAKTIVERLSQEGYIAKYKHFITEDDEELYEILAPSFEAEEIQAVLIELNIM
ncbi:MAG TPA: hypothetical protein VFC79_12910 [Tissierellaceae bacterium]|nr:hypothetical protein [Tissierellaceae bacterium]